MSKLHLQALDPLGLLCLQIVEEREKPNWPSLNFLIWEISAMFLFDLVITFLCMRSNIWGGTFGFAENVWKLQGFVGATMDQTPLLFGELMESKGRMWVRAEWSASVTQHGKGSLIHVHKAKQMEIQFIQNLREQKAETHLEKEGEDPGAALTDKLPLVPCSDRIFYEPW